MMYDRDGWLWYSGWGWGGWILMAFVMVVFWALVITAVLLAVRYLTGEGGDQNRSTTGPAPAGGRAEEVLAERFARGEIDEDEFRRRLTLLREHR